MKKIFILGMGAQKAGTTWMHDYLDKYKETDFGFKKEYHVLDFKLKPFQKMGINRFFSLEDIKNYRKELINHKRDQIDHNLIGNFLTTAMILHPDLYFSYFNSLLKNEVRISGDFTPEHAGLEKATLKQVKDKFENEGIEVFPIFLMRDPVERIKSNIAMTLAKNSKKMTRDEEISVIKSYQETARESIKSDYMSTIRNIKAVFGERYFISFYETIFSEEETKRLSVLLGLDYIKPNFNTFSNKSRRKKTELSEEHMSVIVENYRNTYFNLYELYGESFINDIWKSCKFLK
tara:strand:- start:9985 stop:10857 length:873 start_codon:yes stop_codon:yes gene_type:complete